MNTENRLQKLEDALTTFNQCLKQLQDQQLASLRLIALHEQWLRDMDPGWKEGKVPTMVGKAGW